MIVSGDILMSAISRVSSKRVHHVSRSAAPSSVAAAVSVCPLSRCSPRIETNSAIRAGRPLRLGCRIAITRKAITAAQSKARRIIVIGEPKMRSPIDGLYGGGAVVLTVSAGVRYGVEAVPTPFTSTLTRTSLFGPACDLYWSRYSLEICWPSCVEERVEILPCDFAWRVLAVPGRRERLQRAGLERRRRSARSCRSVCGRPGQPARPGGGSSCCPVRAVGEDDDRARSDVGRREHRLGLGHGVVDVRAGVRSRAVRRGLRGDLRRRRS